MLRAALVAALASTTGLAAASPSPIVIATGPVAGFALPLGAEICRLYEQATKDVARCSVEATEGSTDNLNRLRSGDVALAVVESDLVADAVSGTGAFAGKPPFVALRAVAGFYADTLTVLVKSDGPVRQLDDLKGKRVAVGEPGHRDPLFADFLEALGWSKADLGGIAEMPYADQVTALCSGKIAAMAVTAPHPNGFMRSALATCGLTPLDLAGLGIDAVVAAHSSYAPVQLDFAQYGGQPHPIQTFGVRAVLIATTKLDDGVVARLMAGIFQHTNDLRRAHPAFGTLDDGTLSASTGLGAERHAAAAKYLTDNKIGDPPSGE
jgi:TRAP transporter TAXI family solute receptor